MKMKQNNITPLEALRNEKEILKNECSESEERLAEHWNYMTNNVGSLLFTSALTSIRNKLGFGPSKHDDEESEESSGSSGVLKGVLGGLLAASPFLWEMTQPMIMGYIMKKIKSLFSKKKKKKKKSSEDDDDDD